MNSQAGDGVGIGRSPLWAVMAFSWVSSLCTGQATTGLYFLTEHTYGFTVRANYALALVGGVAYVVGAMGAGWLLRTLRARLGMSTRASVAAILVVLAGLCLVPLIVPRSAGSWPMWLMMLAYQPLTGVLWPVVERYLSGGRSGAGLRSALGRWNITWSSALVIGMIGVGLAMRQFDDTRVASLVLGSIGGLHLFSLALLWPLGAEPGEHLSDEHEPHPPVYERLLATFRVLLPTSYLVLTALTPYLPAAFGRLGVDPAWAAPLAGAWTLGRVFTFATLERWQGWHGRWWPAAAAVGMLLGGFAMAVAAPNLGGTAGLVLMLAGLLAFGAGMATIYTASLYYAMEVERTDVEAGSTHEALIGVGYTGGPLCGLAAGLIAGAGEKGSPAADLLMMGLVGVIALSVIGRTGWMATRGRRESATGA